MFYPSTLQAAQIIFILGQQATFVVKSDEEITFCNIIKHFLEVL